jgi:hypothetical protein
MMITYVNSFEEAKAYPVMFNTSEIFLDANQDRFYCKAVDRMGKFTMSTYEFHQVENEKPLTSADFVPREQFDALSSKLDNLVALLSAQPTAPATAAPQPEQVAQGKKNNHREDMNNGK